MIPHSFKKILAGDINSLNLLVVLVIANWFRGADFGSVFSSSWSLLTFLFSIARRANLTWSEIANTTYHYEPHIQTSIMTHMIGLASGPGLNSLLGVDVSVRPIFK